MSKRILVLWAISISCIVFAIGFAVGDIEGNKDGYTEGYLTGSNCGIFYENVVGQRPNVYWQLKHMNDSTDDYADAVWEERIRVKSGLPYIENCTGKAGGADDKGITIPQPHSKWGK